MKVGLSTSVIQRGRSGVAQYVFALVQALLRQPHRLDLSLFVLEQDLPLFDFARGSAKIILVPERFRSPVKDILWHQAVLPRLARAERLDVLHVPSYRRMLWRRPCALVTTIHDLAPFHVPGKYDWKRMFYGRVVARRLSHHQHRIIAVSQATAADITQFFEVPRQKISTVYNGMDHSRYFPAKDGAARRSILQRHGLRPPFLLYVARLEHPAKNHVRLIAAFNRFKAGRPSQWQLVFAGGDWHGAETIHAAIAASPFRSDIRSLGFVAQDALPGLYQTASIFVYPSLYEGFGFPPLEAMACGCPVLCSTRGGLGEVVADAAATVDPEDIEALRDQLSKLAQDHALRARFRAAGLVRAKLFHWQHTASQTRATYSQALESNGECVAAGLQLASPMISSRPLGATVAPASELALSTPPSVSGSALMLDRVPFTEVGAEP